MELWTDENLVVAYLNGEEGAIAVLLKRYLKPIYGFIFGMVKNQALAEDLTQEAFVKVWKSLEKYDSEKSFQAWVYRIARNNTIDFIRKKKDLNLNLDYRDDGINYLENILDTEESLEELYIKKEEVEKLEQALDELSLINRQVITLYYIDGLNFREIAEVLDESIDTIKSRQRRSLVQLKKILQK